MIRIIERKKELGTLEVKQRPVSGVWIDVENPKEEDVFFLERELRVPREIVLDCLDEDEVPRVVSERGYTLVIIRVPSQRGKKFETVTLGIIITKKFIITIHRDKLEILEGFFSGEHRFSTSKRVRFMLQIFRVVIQQYTRLLRHMERDLRKAERRFIKHAKNEDILYLMNMKEQVLDFQNAIYENNKVLEAILSGHYIHLYQEDVRIITDIIIDNKQCITMASFLIKNLNNALQTFEWIISNNLNVLMKKLTSLATILSVPLLITGIYGMNISLPLQHDPSAFVILMSICAISALLVTAFFKWKEWL